MLLPVSGSRKKKEAAIAEPEAAVAPKRAAVSKTSSPKPLDCRQGPVESWSRAGRMRSLHLSPPGDDEPVAIPLSTAEKCVFALENYPVTIKNLFQTRFGSWSVARIGFDGNEGG